MNIKPEWKGLAWTATTVVVLATAAVVGLYLGFVIVGKLISLSKFLSALAPL